MGGCQSQHGNGNGGTGHVDGGPQRNGNGVGIGIEPQPFAEGQIHRNIGSGRSGKEGIHAAVFHRGPHQGIGILTGLQIHNERIHDKSHKAIGNDEHSQKLGIPQERGKAGGSHGIGYQSHNPQRCKVNDPADHFRNGAGQIIEAVSCRFTGGAAKGNAKNHRPGQDTDVVGMHKGRYGIIHHAQNEGMKDFHNAAGRCQLRIRCHRQIQGRREKERHTHPYQGCAEGGNHVKLDNRLNAVFCILLLLGHGIHHKEEHQNRRYPFQGLHEQIAENLHHRNHRLEKQGYHDTNHKTYGDLLNQRHSGHPFFYCCKQNKPPLSQ